MRAADTRALEDTATLGCERASGPTDSDRPTGRRTDDTGTVRTDRPSEVCSTATEHGCGAVRAKKERGGKGKLDCAKLVTSVAQARQEAGYDDEHDLNSMAAARTAGMWHKHDCNLTDDRHREERLVGLRHC